MCLKNRFSIYDKPHQPIRVGLYFLLALILGIAVSYSASASDANIESPNLISSSPTLTPTPEIPVIEVTLDGNCDEYPEEFSIGILSQELFGVFGGEYVYMCIPNEMENPFAVDLRLFIREGEDMYFWATGANEFNRTYPNIDINQFHPVVSSSVVFGSDIEIQMSAEDLELEIGEIPKLVHLFIYDLDEKALYSLHHFSGKSIPRAVISQQAGSSETYMDLAQYHGLKGGWQIEIIGSPLFPQPIDIVSGLESEKPGLFVFLKDYLSESGVVQRISYISPDAQEEYCHIDLTEVIWFLSSGPDNSALATVGKDILKINGDCTTEPFANAFAEHNGIKAIFHPFDYSPEFGVLAAPQNNEALYRLENGEYEKISGDFRYMVSAIWGPDGIPIIWDGALGKIFHGDEVIYSHSTQRGFADIALHPEDETKLFFIQHAPTLQEIDLNTGNIQRIGVALDYCTWNPNSFIISPDGNTLIFVDPARGEIGKDDLGEDKVTILSEGTISPALSVSPDGTINTIASSCDGGYIQRYHPNGDTSRITGLPNHLLDMMMNEQGDFYVLGTQNQFTGEDINLYILDPEGNQLRTIPLPIQFRADSLSILLDGSAFMCDHFNQTCMTPYFRANRRGFYSKNKFRANRARF